MPEEQKAQVHLVLARYKHDCDECQFVGHYQGSHCHYDLYAHWEGRQKTVIARYGNEPAAYESGLPAALHSPPLKEALRLAVNQKVIPRNVVYPIELRRACRDDLETIEGFGREALETLFEKLQYALLDERTRRDAAQIVRDIWQRYYVEDRVEVSERHMPEFVIRNGVNSTLEFQWKYQEIGPHPL